MNRKTLIGTIAAAALALGGIGIGAAIAANGTPEPISTVATEATTSAAPAEADSAGAATAKTTQDAVELTEEDRVFLAYVREQTPDWTPTALPDMSEADLISAGHFACEQIAAGVDTVTLRLVPGEEPSPMGDYVDSSAIFNGAISAYCRDLVEWPEG